ncbi:MAG: hypothetical protein KDA99_19020, partial [Planctomycetales bacterium]|nr:hypothetical protein [Planctomycetales bacterium]
MVQRAWVVGIVTFWVLSMGWLTATKIAPLFRRGDQPIQQVFRPDEEPSPVAMRWRVEYRERVVGWAETTVVRHDDLTGAVQSVVTFRELPLKDVASDLFGALSMLLQAAGELENLQASLVVNTQMRFDAEGQLTRFNTHVHVADMTNLLELNGHVRDNILQLVAFLNTPRSLREDGESSGRRELVRR